MAWSRAGPQKEWWLRKAERDFWEGGRSRKGSYLDKALKTGPKSWDKGQEARLLRREEPHPREHLLAGSRSGSDLPGW